MKQKIVPDEIGHNGETVFDRKKMRLISIEKKHWFGTRSLPSMTLRLKINNIFSLV